MLSVIIISVVLAAGTPIIYSLSHKDDNNFKTPTGTAVVTA